MAAGGHRLGNRVEWVHVFETPFVAEVIRGGEFLLTTGIGLAGLPATEVGALVAGLARAGAAGIGFEPTHAPAAALIEPCRRHELPLLVFGRDVRFVDITRVVHERLVSSELATLRRAVGLQAQLREAAREGLGPAGLVAALGDVLEAQVLLERADRTPIASSPEDGLDVAFMDALDRHRQRLPTPLHSRPVNPAARLHVLPGRGDELDLLAVDEAAFLLSVAMAAQPPQEEVPSAERARLLQRLAEGRAGSSADILRRARSVGVDLSRATLWAFHGRGALARLERMGLDALVDGPRALVAVRGDLDPAALARDLVRRDVTAVGYDTRGTEPWQVRDALAARSARASSPPRPARRSGMAPSWGRSAGSRATSSPASASSRAWTRGRSRSSRPWSRRGGRRPPRPAASGSPARGCTSGSPRFAAATASTPTCRRPASSWRSRCGRCGWASWRNLRAWPA